MRGASVVASLGLMVALHASHGQTPETRASLLQVEVGDSIGLPLPDATLEVFWLMERAVFREWVRVGPGDLPEGIHLLRFSHPGYRTSVFSVPLRKGTIVSLRVRLGAERDTSTRRSAIEATVVRSIGILIDGRSKSDIIRSRRVIERDAFERAQPASVVELMRQARGMRVLVSPGGAGNAMIGAEGDGGMYGCPLPVLINGDPRFITTFADATAEYTPDDVEAIELIPRTTAARYLRRLEEGGCGVLAIWVR